MSETAKPERETRLAPAAFREEDVAFFGPRQALGLTGLWLLLLALFSLIPAIDIDMQRLFFRSLPCPQGGAATVCGIFPLSQSDTLRGLRRLLFMAPNAVALLLLLRLVLAWSKIVPAAHLLQARLALLLVSFCLGPGLLVNAIFKSHSGRPRPAETDLFGGTMAFRPAGAFDGACTSNCSFVSGEAAGLAWLVLAALILPPRLRPAVLPAVAALAGTGMVMRMAFGRHFLSDITLGALSTPVVAAWVGLAAVLMTRIRFAGSDTPATASTPSPKSHQ